MSFNGINGDLNVPGEVPWEFVVGYFTVAILLALTLGHRYGGLRRFTTLDLVYIAVGGALGVVWEFYIGSFLSRLLPSSPFIDIGFWGRIIIILIFISLVRKVGAGMLSLLIFNVLSDLFHYGFGGEPIFTIYEMFTYGLFIDLTIAFTKGKIFGIGTTLSDDSQEVVRKLQRRQNLMAAVQGTILGVLFAMPDPLFYLAFFRPFLYGSVVNWQTVQFDLLAAIPGNVVFVTIGALLAIRVARAVGQ
ncbi:hypothetical protein GWK48_00060 [Metallosphaera tengchongensis]|uniref:Uncharacterized protein n=1 Tax=Metallosphaera tengchongensis TaxID=1532350 RepID=A0A6N0NV49_9CREN|nr:hypothetical protein [Metallosphaera tengchongensis]QKQ99000.1 hypothetical protein GWK48_00060 [Metallosphaera tengchongensis]